jgi:hypothetical protein
MEQGLSFSTTRQTNPQARQMTHLPAFRHSVLPTLDRFFRPRLGAPQPRRMVDPLLDGVDRIEHT